MVGIFKQKTPVNIILLFVLGILIKLPMFRGQAPMVESDDSFLFRELSAWLDRNLSARGIAILTYLLIFIQAMILNRLVNEYRLIPKNTFLPGLSYLLITSLIPGWNLFSAPLLTNLFLLLIFWALFHLYTQQKIRGLVFNIGLAMGLCSFFSSSALVFIIWVLPGLFVMKPVRLQDWIICVLGVLTPYYLYAAYLLLFDEWRLDKILPEIHFNIPGLQPSYWLAGAAFLILVPFLVGGYYIQVSLRRMLIQIRKYWSLVMIFLLVSLILPFLSQGQDFENWVACVIPLSVFHTCAYYYPERKTFPLMIFWITIAFLVARIWF